MRGFSYNWTEDEDKRLAEACAIPGGLFKLADELGRAYSTLTRRVRRLNLRPIAAPRPDRSRLTAPVNFRKGGFNTRPKGAKAPEGVAVNQVLPAVQYGPSHPIDERFQCDPNSYPEGAGFVAQWRQLRGK